MRACPTFPVTVASCGGDTVGSTRKSGGWWRTCRPHARAAPRPCLGSACSPRYSCPSGYRHAARPALPARPPSTRHDACHNDIVTITTPPSYGGIVRRGVAGGAVVAAVPAAQRAADHRLRGARALRLSRRRLRAQVLLLACLPSPRPSLHPLPPGPLYPPRPPLSTSPPPPSPSLLPPFSRRSPGGPSPAWD